MFFWFCDLWRALFAEISKIFTRYVLFVPKFSSLLLAVTSCRRSKTFKSILKYFRLRFLGGASSCLANLVLHFCAQICNQPISTNIAFCWNFALLAKTYAPKISGDTKASRNFRADEVRRRIRLGGSVKFERKIYLLVKPVFFRIRQIWTQILCELKTLLKFAQI